MLLENKNAVIYGAAGTVGAAVARAFAREGARVFLTGRNLYALNSSPKKSGLPAERRKPRTSTRSTSRR